MKLINEPLLLELLTKEDWIKSCECLFSNQTVEAQAITVSGINFSLLLGRDTPASALGWTDEQKGMFIEYDINEGKILQLRDALFVFKDHLRTRGKLIFRCYYQKDLGILQKTL